ncbi:Shedu immune nuclease family protein [Xanthomonas campestris]|uniref:Shedu immune nuclease family protein n=1 Tax=Xanthomonas campestris TaxID=339 RepID=UPI00236738C8|nr:Shedu immune nuclease family protein [Xanthomonas campestris]WDJ04737.1 DUF4263 domain-containing protein [Xanthomonas campestris pv. incanae]
MDDADYIEKKRSDRIYVSKPFQVGVNKDREARYITRVFDEGDRSAFDSVDDEIVIRATHNDKVQVKAVVTSDDHKIQQLTLQSFRIYKDGVRPNEQYGINLHGSEITRLLQFAELATKLEVTTPGRLRIDEEALSQFDIDDAARAWLQRNPDVVREIVEHQVTSQDVVAVAYRRKQLEAFDRLLHDAEYFDKAVAAKFNGSEEALWQAFFEKNRWIFGYGLFYLSASGFTNKKLEQIVAGATVATDGKRADGLLRTRGLVGAVCLVEIKKHRTPLLKLKPYRDGVWPPSAELAGAVSQTLLTVDGMERQFQKMLPMPDEQGNPTGEDAVIARPRSVVVCGSLSEFVTERGINHDRFRSFELYRRHLVSPDVVTFDELYERARLIVESSES